MNIKYQQFTKLYNQYINDYNLIRIALQNIKKLNIHYIELTDIYCFVTLFEEIYSDYQDDILNNLNKFADEHDNLLKHTPSDKYIVSDRVLESDFSDIYNHYNKIKLVEEQFKLYLNHKYPVNDNIKEKRKVYRHAKLLT